MSAKPLHLLDQRKFQACTKDFERLLTKLRAFSLKDEETGCLVWQGATVGRMGYGRIQYCRRDIPIHKLVYMVFTGTNPHSVRHTCDNPLCWNFIHLVGGSHEDNMADMVERDRQVKGSGHAATKLTEEQVKAIRTSSLSGTYFAYKFGVSKSTISSIRKDKHWRHI